MLTVISHDPFFRYLCRLFALRIILAAKKLASIFAVGPYNHLYRKTIWASNAAYQSVFKSLFHVRILSSQSYKLLCSVDCFQFQKRLFSVQNFHFPQYQHFSIVHQVLEPHG